MAVTGSSDEVRALGLRLIREGKYEEACQRVFLYGEVRPGALDDPDRRLMINDQNVGLAREFVGLLCSAGQLKYAEKFAEDCPPDLVSQLDLGGAVDRLVHLRRFEMASRAISKFGMLDKREVKVLHRFLSALVTQSQYRLAVDWARKIAEWEVRNNEQLPDVLRWTPSSLVSAMVVAEDYDQALKFIHELNLRSEYPVQDLIGHMLANSQFKQALEHIKCFGLEPHFPPLSLMDGMLDAQDWETAVRFANEVRGLWDHFPKTNLIERMISAKDWAAVILYIQQFRIVDPKPDPNGEAPPVLVEFIRALIAAAELFKAMKYVLKFELQKTFPPEKLIQNMIDVKQHEHALRYMKLLNLESKFEDQKKRIKQDQIAALRLFRGIQKRRRESARMSRGLLGASSFSSGVFPDLGMGNDTKICEKLWYVSPHKTIVKEIPPRESEHELIKRTQQENKPPLQEQQLRLLQQQQQQLMFLKHHEEQMNFMPERQQAPSSFLGRVSSDFDTQDNGEEIILLGSGSSLNETYQQQSPPQGAYQGSPPQSVYQQSPPRGIYQQQSPSRNAYEQSPPQSAYQQKPLQSQQPADFLEQLLPSLSAPDHFNQQLRAPPPQPNPYDSPFLGGGHAQAHQHQQQHQQRQQQHQPHDRDQQQSHLHTMPSQLVQPPRAPLEHQQRQQQQQQQQQHGAPLHGNPMALNGQQMQFGEDAGQWKSISGQVRASVENPNPMLMPQFFGNGRGNPSPPNFPPSHPPQGMLPQQQQQQQQQHFQQQQQTQHHSPQFPNRNATSASPFGNPVVNSSLPTPSCMSAPWPSQLSMPPQTGQLQQRDQSAASFSSDWQSQPQSNIQSGGGGTTPLMPSQVRRKKKTGR
mmetsp:Transcript_7067/g.13055  ORF Transcript_7067/g.13055 Transcript_7067/m.13055 type:complete len:864 (+) Transcript_7067:273-2864(+)